ncbi:hypothetical protein MNEG_11416, partial [Monoraphidium neglectum]
LLAHRSFKTYRPVEYFLSFLAVHAIQGPPIEWVSNHRASAGYLESLTLTPPHPPGTTTCTADVERSFLDRANARDLSAQAFYRLMEATWVHQAVARYALTFAVAGYPGIVWSMAFPTFIGWHETFLVNSAAHMWGRQPWNTGDLSRNNWWVALISFGEGWHNSHHAFPSSAAHGLDPWEIDIVYTCIRIMAALGLAWDVKLPSKRDMERRRQPDGKQKAW